MKYLIMILITCSMAIAEPLNIKVGRTVEIVIEVTDDKTDDHAWIINGLQFVPKKLDNCVELETDARQQKCLWSLRYTFTEEDMGPQQVTIRYDDKQATTNSVSKSSVFEYIVSGTNNRPKLRTVSHVVIDSGN